MMNRVARRQGTTEVDPLNAGGIHEVAIEIVSVVVMTTLVPGRPLIRATVKVQGVITTTTPYRYPVICAAHMERVMPMTALVDGSIAYSTTDQPVIAEAATGHVAVTDTTLADCIRAKPAVCVVPTKLVPLGDGIATPPAKSSIGAKCVPLGNRVVAPSAVGPVVATVGVLGEGIVAGTTKGNVSAPGIALGNGIIAPSTACAEVLTKPGLADGSYGPKERTMKTGTMKMAMMPVMMVMMSMTTMKMGMKRTNNKVSHSRIPPNTLFTQ